MLGAAHTAQHFAGRAQQGLLLPTLDGGFVQLGQPHPQTWMIRLLSQEKFRPPRLAQGLLADLPGPLRIDTAMEPVPKYTPHSPTLLGAPRASLPPGPT